MEQVTEQHIVLRLLGIILILSHTQHGTSKGLYYLQGGRLVSCIDGSAPSWSSVLLGIQQLEDTAFRRSKTLWTVTMMYNK
jgi:hypothetical protein